MQPGIKEFDATKSALKESTDALRSLEKTLQSYRVEGSDQNAGKIYSKKRLQPILNSMHKIGGATEAISEQLSGVAISAEKLTVLTSLLMSQEENGWRLELEKKNKMAEWEKANQYKVWLHKTVRWVVGAIVVIVLYSGAVWLQSKCDFIKIPVRDWIIQSQPAP